ncbi:MAG: Xaa-Pro peptidase family protein [bacterium]|jgi:creatinase|nr:Xaa-Pro peptidase family protein [bacterium]
MTAGSEEQTLGVFSEAEIRRRWDEVRSRLAHAECVVSPTFHNSYYLSGLPVKPWGRFAITVLFRDHDPVLVLPEFEQSAAAALSPIRDVRTYRDDEGPSLDAACLRLAGALRERGVRVVGIEAFGMSVAMFERLRLTLPEVALWDETAAIDETRIRSSEEEIAFLREACRLSALGMHAVLEGLRPGVIETRLSEEARLAMERGARPDLQVDATAYMQQGVRSLLCHAGSTNAPIAAGQVIEVVCEAHVWHYQGTVERGILVGSAPPEVERAYGVMLEAYRQSLAAVRPGVTFAEIDGIGRRILNEAGYDAVTNGAGLIRNIHDHTGGRIPTGDLRPYNSRPLEPGMVVSVEPWALVPGVGGPRHGDLVLVTETGGEVLSDVPIGELRV